MQELINRFIKNGLTEEQAQTSLSAISQWLDENYPVAGAVIASWIRCETA